MTRHPKRAIGLTLGAAAVLALAVATVGSASDRAGGTTITLAAVQTSFTTVPLVPKASPPRVGDRMIFENALYNVGRQFGRPNGARIGSADIVCTLVSKRYMECAVTARIPHGQLVLSGSISTNSKSNQYAITGGVGSYAGAAGSATGRDVSRRKTLVTIDLDA